MRHTRLSAGFDSQCYPAGILKDKAKAKVKESDSPRAMVTPIKRVNLRKTDTLTNSVQIPELGN